MRNNLKALQEYEVTNKSFELLCNFIAVKNSNLVKRFCNGDLYLPSFILLKKLQEKFSDLVIEDEELKALFINAIECSKLFYARTVTLTKNSTDLDNDFDGSFKKEVQPLGQQLINLLMNIKYRIRVVRLKRQKAAKKGLMRYIDKISSFMSPFQVAINNFIYKISLLQSSYYGLARKVYCFIVILVIVSFWTINSLFLHNIHAFSITFINTVFCLVITILAMITYPVGYFGKIDINGKGIVAYKYRIFFNSISNRKIYNIFALQQTNDTGQQSSQSIESSQYESI